MWKLVVGVHLVVALLFVLILGGQETPTEDIIAVALPRENTALNPEPGFEDDFYNWHERLADVKAYVEEHPVDLVFIGDSIFHMFGGPPEASIARGQEVWEEYYGERNAVNMGFGWDRTQNVLWRIADGALEEISPKVAIVLIGTNNLTQTERAEANSPAEISAAIEEICEEIQDEAPDCKVLLLSLLPRAPEEYVKPIQAVNALNALHHDMPGVTYLDLTPQFAGEDGLPKPELMHDSVHPNAAGYRVMAETIEPVLAELMLKAEEAEEAEETEETEEVEEAETMPAPETNPAP